MAQRLVQAKHDYMNHISQYMHDNHISYKTLEETKATWQERAYDATIEDALINQSLLFFNALDKELNIDFRKKLAHFMANYLSAYIAKAPRYEHCKNTKTKQAKAMLTLKNLFTEKLKRDEETRKARKASKRPHKSQDEYGIRITCEYNPNTGGISTSTEFYHKRTNVTPQLAAIKHARYTHTSKIKDQSHVY